MRAHAQDLLKGLGASVYDFTRDNILCEKVVLLMSLLEMGSQCAVASLLVGVINNCLKSSCSGDSIARQLQSVPAFCNGDVSTAYSLYYCLSSAPSI